VTTASAAIGAPPAPISSEPFDPSARYGLDPQVALRPEPFGALAYHYGTRRLTFLRSPLLAQVVRDLEDHPSADSALITLVPDAERPAFRRALAALVESRFIRAI
jgi:mycofactocin biosynthesis protein MftB